MEKEQKNTFSKAERLKSRKQTGALFAGGKTFLVHPIKVFYSVSKDFSVLSTAGNFAVKVGVSASKRNFKKAVDRNRVKRLLREVYRLNKQSLVKAAKDGQFSVGIFFVYIDKHLPEFSQLEEKMKICLGRIQKKMEEGNEGMLQR